MVYDKNLYSSTNAEEGASWVIVSDTTSITVQMNKGFFAGYSENGSTKNSMSIEKEFRLVLNESSGVTWDLIGNVYDDELEGNVIEFI